MQDRPTAVELLVDIAELLEHDVMPALEGPVQHQVRVAGNLCRILSRELALGPPAAQRESELLSGLLGREPRPAAPVEQLNRMLVDRLRAGADEELEAAAWSVLVDVAKDKVAIAKPGYDSFDFRSEVEQ